MIKIGSWHEVKTNLRVKQLLPAFLLYQVLSTTYVIINIV